MGFPIVVDPLYLPDQTFGTLQTLDIRSSDSSSRTARAGKETVGIIWQHHGNRGILIFMLRACAAEAC